METVLLQQGKTTDIHDPTDEIRISVNALIHLYIIIDPLLLCLWEAKAEFTLAIMYAHGEHKELAVSA